MSKKDKPKDMIPVVRSLEPNPSWQPIAAIAGWLIPGAGHFLLGQRTRGIVIGLTILMIFFVGLMIGGLGILDWRQPPERAPERNEKYVPQKISFLGVWQPLLGPGAIGCLYKRSLDKKYKFNEATLTLNYRDEYGNPIKSAYAPRFGFSYEIGVLYTAIAGMLNLLAIIDVIYADPKFRKANDAVKSGDSNNAEGIHAEDAKDVQKGAA